eukprot:357725-Chlamydomonas_euryale.AAC.1
MSVPQSCTAIHDLDLLVALHELLLGGFLCQQHALERDRSVVLEFSHRGVLQEALKFIRVDYLHAHLQVLDRRAECQAARGKLEACEPRCDAADA